jgi:hypothetical protein
LSDYFHLEAGRSFFANIFGAVCSGRPGYSTRMICQQLGLVAMMVAEVDEAKQIRNVVSR